MTEPSIIAAELRALQARLRASSSSSSRAASSRPASSRPKRDRRRQKRATFIASLEARGALGCRPRDFKARTIASVRAVFENRSGREARLALRRFPRSWRAVVVAVARHPGDGRELGAELNAVWSRWVVACALLLWCERRRSRRKGCRGRVDGFTQGMIRGLFRNRDGAPYSRSRVFGTSYRAGSETCSPFVALERAGVCFWSAPRLEEANPAFVGPPRLVAGRMRRFAFAVYWLRRDVGSG